MLSIGFRLAEASCFRADFAAGADPLHECRLLEVSEPGVAVEHELRKVATGRHIGTVTPDSNLRGPTRGVFCRFGPQPCLRRNEVMFEARCCESRCCESSLGQ